MFVELYKPAAGLSATVSLINVCNFSQSVDYFRIIIVRGADAEDLAQQRVHYDERILGNSAFERVSGITLNDTSSLRVWSQFGNLAFQAFGVEG